MKTYTLYFLLSFLPLFGLAQKKEKVSSQQVAEINEATSSLFLIKDLQLLNEEAYRAIYFWVYTYNQPSKEDTKKRITDAFSDIEAKCAKSALTWNHAGDQQLLQSILQNMQAMMQQYQEVSQALVTFEDYENSMTKFMMEELVASSVEPLKLENNALFSQLLENRQTKLMFIQHNLSGKNNRKEKLQNIEKLLSLTIKVELFSILNLSASGEDRPASSDHLILQQKLTNALIPVYDTRFSNKEIKELLKFHQSTLGKKLREEQHAMQLESLLLVKKLLEETTAVGQN